MAKLLEVEMVLNLPKGRLEQEAPVRAFENSLRIICFLEKRNIRSMHATKADKTTRNIHCDRLEITDMQNIMLH